MKRWYIFILAGIVLAALVSGCTGSNSNETATPTPLASGSASTPIWNATDLPSRASQLFHLDNLNWYEYRFYSQLDALTLNLTYKYEYGDEAINGIAVKHSRATFDNYIVDLYTSKVNNSPIGGHYMSTLNGMTWTGKDLTGKAAAGYFDGELDKQVKAAKDAGLTNGGQETIIVNGKTYACTRYKYTVDDRNYTAWYTPQAPAPVKVAVNYFVNQKPVSPTFELLGWG